MARARSILGQGQRHPGIVPSIPANLGCPKKVVAVQDTHPLPGTHRASAAMCWLSRYSHSGAP